MAVQAARSGGESPQAASHLEGREPRRGGRGGVRRRPRARVQVRRQGARHGGVETGVAPVRHRDVSEDERLQVFAHHASGQLWKGQEEGDARHRRRDRPRGEDAHGPGGSGARGRSRGRGDVRGGPTAAVTDRPAQGAGEAHHEPGEGHRGAGEDGGAAGQAFQLGGEDPGGAGEAACVSGGLGKREGVRGRTPNTHSILLYIELRQNIF
mmetsp:Transcript_13608/g.53709  ORF Transcript_13608/g.53709 Transcript_13608/m.53709 type:complete len:210 (-) Transcript_13608:8-637(-)